MAMAANGLGDSILVGDAKNFTSTISTFCHELAHFINWKTGKYPFYHSLKPIKQEAKRFKTFRRYVRYALDAEIATEILGAKICKEWFPGVKYRRWYYNTDSCYSFLAGYYISEFR